MRQDADGRVSDIRITDVGQHVFALPDLFGDGAAAWLESPDYEMDTEAVILLDRTTGKVGRAFIRAPRLGESDYMRQVAMLFIDEEDELFATQEAAIRAAITDERRYAANILRACEKWEKALGGDSNE